MRSYPANGGHIIEQDDRYIMVLDPDVVAKIAAATGEDIPQRMPVNLFCHPTFPILAPLGGFVHPGKGACWPMQIPESWARAWRA